MSSPTIQDNIKKAMNKTSSEYLPYILISLIVMLFLIYIVNKITLNYSNCLTLKNLYTTPPNITNIDFEEVLNFHQKNNAEATIVLKKIFTPIKK